MASVTGHVGWPGARLAGVASLGYERAKFIGTMIKLAVFFVTRLYLVYAIVHASWIRPE